MTHRRVLSFSCTLLLIVISGCNGENAGSMTCEDYVDIEFIALHEGDHVLEGFADDRPFTCELFYTIENAGENPEDFQLGGVCTGARIAENMRLVVLGTPAKLSWSATWTDPYDSTVRETSAGAIDLEYHDDGACQVARAYLPRW